MAEWPTAEQQQLDPTILTGVSLLEQPMSIFPFAPFLLATHILLLDWNENVVPKLLAIFRSV